MLKLNFFTVNKLIFSSVLLLLLASCSKKADNSNHVICPGNSYTQWLEVKGLVGGVELTNPNILTINDDSVYYYNPKNFHYLYIPTIDSIGFIKTDNRTLSFISRDKKDTTTFFYSVQNDTLHLSPLTIIQMQGEMLYKKVH